jgi:hypothetical protein
MPGGEASYAPGAAGELKGRGGKTIRLVLWWREGHGEAFVGRRTSNGNEGQPFK